MYKILFIRFSSIGDILLTTPIIRATRAAFPDAELHFVTKKVYSDVLAEHPCIDKIHLLEEGAFSTLANTLKKEKFDFIADLHNNIRSARLKTTLYSKSATFPKLNLEKWLKVNLKWDKLPNIHIVDRLYKAVEPIGVKPDNKGLDFYISDEAREETNKLPSNYKNRYDVLVIGAKFGTKQMPLTLLQEIVNGAPNTLILLGGQEDHAKASQLEGNVFNACGAFSLQGSAAILEGAQKVITPDTGMMHIAAALKKPILSIWGNTIPEFGMYPWFGRENGTEPMENYLKAGGKIAQVDDLSCRPCSKLGFEHCPKQHFKCMTEIKVAEVIDWLEN